MYVGTVFEKWHGARSCETSLDCGPTASPLFGCYYLEGGRVQKRFIPTGKYCACSPIRQTTGPNCTQHSALAVGVAVLELAAILYFSRYLVSFIRLLRTRYADGRSKLASKQRSDYQLQKESFIVFNTSLAIAHMALDVVVRFTPERLLDSSMLPRVLLVLYPVLFVLQYVGPMISVSTVSLPLYKVLLQQKHRTSVFSWSLFWTLLVAVNLVLIVSLIVLFALRKNIYAFLLAFVFQFVYVMLCLWFAYSVVDELVRHSRLESATKLIRVQNVIQVVTKEWAVCQLLYFVCVLLMAIPFVQPAVPVGGPTTFLELLLPVCSAINIPLLVATNIAILRLELDSNSTGFWHVSLPETCCFSVPLSQRMLKPPQNQHKTVKHSHTRHCRFTPEFALRTEASNTPTVQLVSSRICSG